MEPQAFIKCNIFDDPLEDAEELEETSEDDLLSRLFPDFN
jgi:hypothetical protein